LAGGDGIAYGSSDVGFDQLNSIEALRGTAANDLIYADATAMIDGGGGIDYLVEIAAGATVHLGGGMVRNVEIVVLNAGFNIVDVTGDAFEYIWGTTGDDVITLDSGGGYLWGGGGVNVLNGGAQQSVLIGDVEGVSQLNGHSGNDLFYVTAHDTVTAVAGYNYLVYVDVAATGAHLDLGSELINYAVGGAGDDFISNAGATSSIILFGLDGGDTLTGGAGDDQIVGGAGNDLIIGGGGTDYLFGEAGDDTLVGGVGAAYLDGGAGANVFSIDGGWQEYTIGEWAAGSGNLIDFTALACLGIHSLADLTIRDDGLSTMLIHADIDGTRYIALVGFAGGLSGADFIFA
jgi:RTX calcium-binding nonapeptide repeat (4 copies)